MFVSVASPSFSTAKSFSTTVEDSSVTLVIATNKGLFSRHQSNRNQMSTRYKTYGGLSSYHIKLISTHTNKFTITNQTRDQTVKESLSVSRNMLTRDLFHTGGESSYVCVQSYQTLHCCILHLNHYDHHGIHQQTHRPTTSASISFF